jgi:hypothetical protein
MNGASRRFPSILAIARFDQSGDHNDARVVMLLTRRGNRF